MQGIPSELRSQACLGESSTRMGDLLVSPRVAPLILFSRPPEDLEADKNSNPNGIYFPMIIKTLSFFTAGKKNGILKFWVFKYRFISLSQFEKKQNKI